MNSQLVSHLLTFYGVFLIVAAVVSVTFIGMKAKTALMSGGTSGLLSLITAYFVKEGVCVAQIAGMVLSAGLLVVFSWRATKTLFAIFDMIHPRHPDLNGKGIAFLIISMMAIVSLFVLAVQLLCL